MTGGINLVLWDVLVTVALGWLLIHKTDLLKDSFEAVI